MSVETQILCSTSLFAVTLGVVSALAPATADAQNAPAATAPAALGEIVVTAERRVENVQKTSASVTVRAGQDLVKEGRFTLQAILEDVPGITGGAASATAGVVGGGTDTPAAGLVIRGIPSNIGAGGSTTSTASAAAVYVDGVYSGIGGDYDIDRVEVVRGPQGTLYGRSATSGLVAITTRNPNLKDLGGSATLEAGNFNLQHYTAVVNLPIVSDQLAIRVSGNLYKRDGYIDPLGGAIRNSDARIKVLYKPNDNVSLLAGAALQDNVDHNGGHEIGASLVPGAVTYVDVPVGKVNNNFRQYWAELNVNLGFGTLTYQPAYRTWKQAGVINSVTPLGVGTQPLSTPKDNFLTQELRLSSSPGSKLIWQAGIAYYKNDLVNSNISNFNGQMAFGVDETKQTEALGVFAQATYPVTETTRITAGVRYDHTTVSTGEIYQLGPFLFPPNTPLPPPFVLSGAAGKRKFNNVTYKLRLEHDLAPTNLLYASVSTGFSPGDVVVAASCPASISLTPPCPIELKAETLTSYEIGSKNRFLDDKLQVNGDVFYSTYGAFQSGAINVNEGAGPPAFAPLASPMKSYGVEIEARYKITPADLLSLNFSAIKSLYFNKPPLFARFVAEDEVTDSGAWGSVAPIPVSASFAYQHVFTLPGDSTLRLRAEVLYSSGHGGHLNAAEQANGQQPLVHIDSAVTGNLNATWTPNDRFSVSAYVRNLSNLRYFTKIILDSSGPSYQYQPRYNDPRTFGIVLNVNF